MPLTLVTGPANAEKAGFVLGAYRAALDRDPLLVVPTFADVEHYRRELAEAGRRVRRAGPVGRALRAPSWRAAPACAGRPLGPLARERVAAAVAARARLRVLAASAATPGFPAALLRLADELAERRVDAAPLRRRDARLGRRRAGARAVRRRSSARCTARSRHALDGARRGPTRSARLRRARRAAPGPVRAGAASPVLLYGFDDLTALQLDAVETLARHAGAEVTVSLTYEPGRVAFAGRGATFHELLALADRHVALEARAEHYAPAAREALHHLERGLFETDGAGRPGRPSRRRRGAAARGRRPARRARARRRARSRGSSRDEGYAPEDVAVVVRDPEPDAAAARAGLRGAAACRSRSTAACRPATRRSAAASWRCCAARLLGGSADDLLSLAAHPGPARAPGARRRARGRSSRREGAASAAAARELWERRHPTLPAAEPRPPGRRRRARAGRRCASACRPRSRALFAAPWRRTAAVLTGPDELDARVAARAARRARRARGAGRAPTARLAPSRGGARRPAGRGSRSATGDARAARRRRRHRDRRRSARGASARCSSAGCRRAPSRRRRAARAVPGRRRAPRRQPPGGACACRCTRTRWPSSATFFYAAVSRPTDRLALSWHAADEDGRAGGALAVRGRRARPLRPELLERARAARARRGGVAGRPRADRARAPARRRRRAARPARERADRAAAPPRGARGAGGRATWSASALEQWAGCPVQVVRRAPPGPRGAGARPRGDAPRRPGPRACSRTSCARCASDGIPLVARAPRRRPAAACTRRWPAARTGARLSTNPERRRSQLRRLEADLLRYLEFAAHDDAAYRPEHFEVTFGAERRRARPRRGWPAARCELRGRIDRVDVDPAGGGAIVVDYKGRSAPPQARWVQDGRLQVGLYVLALRAAARRARRSAGSTSRSAATTRARGGWCSRGEDPGRTTVSRDRVDEAAFAAVLAAVEEAARALP